MHAAALRVDLRLPAVRSLKEKRSRIKALIADVERTFKVAVSEVDHQELWQRATLGVALVAPTAGRLEQLVHRVERYFEGVRHVEVLHVGVAYLEDPE